jgi:hypothetical protein
LLLNIVEKGIGTRQSPWIDKEELREGGMLTKKKSKANEITIYGYLDKIELEDGNLGVLVYDGEDDYYVVMDKFGQQLLDHINEEIEATGTLSKEDGQLVLNVTHFRPVDYYEDMEDDYYFDDRSSA